MAGLQNEARESFGARERLDQREDAPADPLALVRGQRVHALHLAHPRLVAPQGAARDGAAVVAGDEDRRIRVGHLLDGHVRAELGRRDGQQVRVELGDQRAHLILQRALDGDRDGHLAAVHRADDVGPLHRTEYRNAGLGRGIFARVQIAELWRCPVKSLQGERLDADDERVGGLAAILPAA